MDERLRQLERRVQTGDPDAQSALDAARRRIHGFEPPVGEEQTSAMVRELWPLHCCLKRFDNSNGDVAVRNVARLLSTQSSPVTIDQIVGMLDNGTSDSAVRRCLKKLHGVCLVEVYRNRGRAHIRVE